MKMAAYIRVSTVGQNEEGQRQEVERWLKGNRIKAADVLWFIDKRSGDNLKRPAFEELRKAVFNGEVGTIVVYKLDRLSRSIRDGINTICDWCERSIRVVSVTQQLDFNGTTGKLVASVLFAVAEMEQENRRERQAVGIAVAKRMKKYKGRKRGTFKAKPTRARKLREKGFQMEEIATSLGVTRQTVYRYLNSLKS